MSVLLRCTRSIILAAILITQFHLAIATCSNLTVLNNPIDNLEGFGTTFQQKVDFISCPPSTNLSDTCQLPRKQYTITVPAQLNISYSQNYPGPNEGYIPSEQQNSYVFNVNASANALLDASAIFSLSAQYWASQGLNQSKGGWVAETPQTITVSTMNITNRTQELYVDLEVGQGYYMTLYYNPFMTYLWSRFSGCDNQSLDGVPVEVSMPYFETEYTGNSSVSILAGKFLTETVSLNESVAVPKKSSGVELSGGLGSNSFLIVLGVLGFIIF